VKAINEKCPWSGKPVDANALSMHEGHVIGFCSVEHRDRFAEAVAQFQQAAAPAILTRSYDNARTGSNTKESVLTPAAVRTRGIKRLFSLGTPGDARGCEAQPLIVAGVKLRDGSVRKVVYLATMANDVLAYDADSGQLLWSVNLGTPIKSTPSIDIHMINDHWGIVSTPVIDPAAKILYACVWTSSNGISSSGQHFLHAISLIDGKPIHAPLNLEGAVFNPGHGLPAVTFRSAERKQRAGLLLLAGAVFIGFGTIVESAETARGWLIAVDTAKWNIAATWCSTVRGSGGGIWMSGGGPAVDDQGDIYVITGNGDFDAVTDFGESIVKLKYTPPNGNSTGSIAAVDWWTPWTDKGRVSSGAPAMERPMPSNFQRARYLARMGSPMSMYDWTDQDFGSGGPVLAAGPGVVLAAGKDGILYPANATSLGKTLPGNLNPAAIAANYGKLKAPPILYTYYDPNVSPTPTDAASLNRFSANRTHHLHGTPVFWNNAVHGLMHFCGGENGNLRAWKLNSDGTSTYLACSAEVASAQAPVPLGGMPGWSISLSANGDTNGIVWALIPYTDANMELSAGRFLAYDAQDFGTYGDGSKQIVPLWDSQDWALTFTHPKFNRPVVFEGKVYVATYDGRVDVYGLA
jgi:hypothetical protein